MAEAQPRAIKMERREAKRLVILDRATLLEKGIKIPNLE
jgi:hypothetical protein